MTDITNAVPNPGSEDALRKGCTCPVIDNHYGKGFPYGALRTQCFWMTEGCPVHAPKSDTDATTAPTGGKDG